MSPEFWHRLAVRTLRVAGASPFWRALLRELTCQTSDPVEVMGLKFPNRVGLAAGFDKDATSWRALSCLGFGHIEVGTITCSPQQGNPRPRIWKLPAERAIKNSMGSPNPGVYRVAERLSGAREVLRGRAILSANIGKGADTPLYDAGKEYASMIRVLGPHVDYITMNLSSPNTKSLRLLQHGDHLHRTLEPAMIARDVVSFLEGRPIPVVVKISPSMSDESLLDVVRILRGWGVDGVVATNTLVTPHNTGGLSGAPLREPSIQALQTIVANHPDFPVFSVGGIMTPEDAAERIRLAADLIQVYTGMIYSGPLFPSRLVRECANV